MRSKGKSWKERICALLLALAMVLTGIMPGSAATVEAAETTDVFFTIKDADNDDGVLNSDITVEVFKKGNTDDSEAIEAELVKWGLHRNTYRISDLEVNEEYVYTKEMIVSKSKNSPFIGKTLKGKVKYTIVNGRVVYEG